MRACLRSAAAAARTRDDGRPRLGAAPPSCPWTNPGDLHRWSVTAAGPDHMPRESERLAELADGESEREGLATHTHAERSGRPVRQTNNHIHTTHKRGGHMSHVRLSSCMSRLVPGACSESLAGRRTCSSLVSRVRILSHTHRHHVHNPRRCLCTLTAYLKRTARDTK